MIKKIKKGVIGIDSVEYLNDYFKDLFDEANTSIKAGARHGVSNAVNALRDSTRQMVATSPFKSDSSTQYGVGLIEGVKAYMQKDATGFVHVLGDTRYNDGTWRLRFFEWGTRNRKGPRGRISSYHFLKDATNFNKSTTLDIIQQAIQEKIDELNR